MRRRLGAVVYAAGFGGAADLPARAAEHAISSPLGLLAGFGLLGLAAGGVALWLTRSRETVLGVDGEEYPAPHRGRGY